MCNRKMLSKVNIFIGLTRRCKQKLSSAKAGVKMCFREKIFPNKAGNINIPEDICKRSIFHKSCKLV